MKEFLEKWFPFNKFIVEFYDGYYKIDIIRFTQNLIYTVNKPLQQIINNIYLCIKIVIN